MSTRSGKRIHDSISENVQSVSEKRIERNTRSKRVKEKSDEIETGKKKNFVRRPSNDEVDSSNDKAKNTFKNGRKSRRNTLKELNMLADDYESLINDRKSKRQSRRTRKGDTVEPINLFILESNEFDTREAKNNNKRAVIGSSENRPVKAVTITKKKTNKKKKKSNSFIVEELVTGEHNKSFNKSNVSIDSFHSAAGSPDNSKDNNLIYNSIEHVKNTKKKSKKTESGNQFETAMNEAGKLCPLNESFGSSVYKKEDIEDEYGNRFDKEISGTSKIKSKQKKSKKKNVLSDIDNTHKKADVVHSLELNNSIEAGIQSTDLKKNTIGKINSPTSNFDFINNPHVKETLNDLKSVSSLNNSAKKRHNSTCKNSSFDNIDISITSLNECHKDISHNLINKSKVILNEISSNNTTELENLKTSRCKDSTYEKIILSDANLDLTFDKTNNSFDKNCNAVKELSHTNRRSSRRESIIQNTTYDKIDDNFVDMYTTFKVNNKEPSEDYHVETKCIEKPRRSSRISVPQGIVTTVLNDTYDKIIEDGLSYCNKKCEKPKLDTTFERTKDNIDGSIQIIFNKKSSIISSDNTDNMTLDMSEDCSRISIVSDNSKTENIVNTTPLLIESSMDESQINTGSILLNKTTTPPKKEPITRIITSDKRGSTSDNNKTPLKRETYTETKTTPLKRDGTYTKLRKKPSNSQSIQNEEHKPQGVEDPTTPLKRQGTFTMESPDVMSPKPRSAEKTPTRGKSMPSPGRTPFFSSGSGSKGRTTSNVTHSIEKPQRRSSAAVAHPKQTRVMFRSPVDNPVAVTPMKGKVIKSNLKGSSKSFMFDESASEQCGSRKRSRTQAGPQPGAARNKRARTASAAARLQGPVVAEVTSPVSKSNQKTRTKLPDFAALHRKQFSKMESLDECQRRHARRARALLSPPAPLTPTVTLTPTAPLTATIPLTSTAALTATEPLISTAPLTPAASLTPIAPREALHRNNPKETSDTAAFQAAKRPVTQKSIEVDKKNQSYTRFGFKINLDVNPFSVPAKTADVHRKDAIKPRVLKRQATLPSLAGTTLRKEAAKQAVMREKFFTDKRDVNRNQNRTVIKGVRTNRRFELQMKMRNID